MRGAPSLAPRHCSLPTPRSSVVPLRLYADVHIPRAIVLDLRLRGVDVLIAQDDQASSVTDPMLLDRAISRGHTLFSIFGRYTDLVEPLNLDEAFRTQIGRSRSRRSPINRRTLSRHNS